MPVADRRYVPETDPYWDPPFPFFKFNMVQPNSIKLVEALQVELQKYFSEVTVEWLSCPDLRKPPFNLFSRGLCGYTGIIQIGGTGEVFEEAPKIEITDIDRIIKLQMIDRFIIGGCIYPLPTNGKLTILTTNMRMRPISWRRLRVKYDTNLMFVDEKTLDPITEPLHSFNFPCGLMGNYFLSEGRSGQVLKIWAKNSLTYMGLPGALHEVISSDPFKMSEDKLFGLGGVYLMENGSGQLHLLPVSRDGAAVTEADIMHNTFVYVRPSPIIGFGTMVNCSSIATIPLMSRSTYGFSADKRGGHYIANNGPEDGVEYLGYFSIAKTMYRINPQKQWFFRTPARVTSSQSNKRVSQEKRYLETEF